MAIPITFFSHLFNPAFFFMPWQTLPFTTLNRYHFFHKDHLPLAFLFIFFSQPILFLLFMSKGLFFAPIPSTFISMIRNCASFPLTSPSPPPVLPPIWMVTQIPFLLYIFVLLSPSVSPDLLLILVLHLFFLNSGVTISVPVPFRFFFSPIILLALYLTHIPLISPLSFISKSNPPCKTRLSILRQLTHHLCQSP